VDPKAIEYIHQGSYVFAGNDPINGYELNGEETIKMLDPLAEIENSVAQADKKTLSSSAESSETNEVSWIKNNKTGEYQWKNEVNSTKNTPVGYTYVGQADSDIVKSLFNGTTFKSSTQDTGLIGVEDYDNPYSSKGAAFFNMTAKTTISANFSAVVNTKYDSNGKIESKDFQGIKIFVSVSGNVIAPYPNLDLKLFKNNMTFQGSEMQTFKPNSNGDIIDRGDVKNTSI